MTKLQKEEQQADYTEFEHSLSVIGWSYKSFCFNYYQDVVNEDYEDETESERFYEKQKKKKQRKKHLQKELSAFILYITNHKDFKKKEIIRPHYLPDEDFSPEFEREMKKISKQITKMIKNQA